MPISLTSENDCIRYAYRHAPIDWRMDEFREASAVNDRGHYYNWRLFHYLSGGGMSALGRTLRQEIVAARQTRFLITAGVLFVLWLILRTI